MGKIRDLTGGTYGRLTVVHRVQSSSPNAKWRCLCECGNTSDVFSGSLTNGFTKSCGCLGKESRYRKLNDLTGKSFGRLRVLHRETSKRHTRWVCVCECGEETIVHTELLLEGRSQSCGCLRTDLTRVRSITHGHSIKAKPTRTYKSWKSAKSRCFNPRNNSYANYGGRGITMCQEWVDDFAAFLRDMGECCPGLTLDRWPNNDGNYEPGNCRWATVKEQNNNRRKRRKTAKI